LTLYQQSVLDALEQVETSLANYAAQRRRSETLAEVNAVNQRAFDLAKSEYAVGMISFLSVLDTQRSLFSTQTDLIRTRQQALVELVNLYESLGGGWPEHIELEEDRSTS
jgi:outer membrane protein TolC